MSDDLTKILANHTRQMLDLSTAHISKATCDAACARSISWANTAPTEFGFVCYVHDERPENTFDDLWAVLEFARLYGFDYVLFDADAPHLPESCGLPSFDW